MLSVAKVSGGVPAGIGSRSTCLRQGTSTWPAFATDLRYQAASRAAAQVAQWRAGHEEFWHSEEMRAELGDPEFTVDDDTLIVAERFRLIERLAGAYLGLTWGGGGRRAARARAAGHPHSPGPGRTGQPPSHRGPG